ncbi:MAG: type 2 periplasmic-binding domain-containing protein [Eubacteriales bacterium]
MKRNTHAGSTAIMLLFILLGTLFAGSCAGDNIGTAVLTSSESESVTDHETAAETDIFEGLESAGLDNMTFTVLSSDINSWNNHYDEELSGDIVNDTIWKRDILTEQRLSVNIENKILSDMTAVNIIKSVQANDYICDMFYFGFTSELGSLLKAGCIFNLNDISHLKLTGAWWNASIAETMTIAGKQPYTSGPISPMYLKSPIVMVFNKNLAADYALDDIYSIVRSGSWTLDIMAEMMTKTSSDLDGDGTINEDNDQFGLSLEGTLANALYTAAGFTEVVSFKDGSWTATINDINSVNFIEKCAEILSDKNAVYIRPDGSTEKHADIFKAGRSLFSDFTLTGVIAYFRDMEDDYGIIPVPKNTKSQEKYKTSCNTWLFNAVAVPSNITDSESVGLVMETLARYSYTELIPAVCEITMEGKMTRDEESVEMLKIIYQNPVFDFNTIFDFGGSHSLVNACILGRKDDFVSGYAALESKMKTEIEKMLTQ